MSQHKKPLSFIAFLVLVCLSTLVSCIFSTKNKEADTAAGKDLASKYCQSCHLLPEPSLLDKGSWKKLLPEMGTRLGIQTAGLKIPDDDKSLYPSTPALGSNEWQSILDYYDNAAPAVLPSQKKTLQLQPSDGSFAALLPPENMFKTNPLVSCIRLDNAGRLFVYDAASKYLYLFSRSGLVDSMYLTDVIVDLQFAGDRIYACSIGASLGIGTSKNTEGKIFEIEIVSNKIKIETTLISGLARPVQVVPFDMNGDQRTDFIVAEFGGLLGSLSWFENKGGGQFTRHLIRETSGAVTIYPEIVSGRQMPDLWVLFAQGEEGIFHFTADDKGAYQSEEILRFPSSYGSTSFQFADMNGDGFRDIIYTCGDNGDVTTVLKPYHGMYIYSNDGKGHFTQSFFYPMHGCYKAIARDFRKTGSLDISVIAYFTDSSNPEWFVYLKNNGGLHFTALAAPKEVNFDSALTMDVGDFDHDGLPDIFIGNALDGEGVRGAPFAILRKVAGPR